MRLRRFQQSLPRAVGFYQERRPSRYSQAVQAL
jgi:hypothetical protein